MPGDEGADQLDRIDVERQRGLTLVFAGGASCFLEGPELRRRCPCATCRGWRDRGEAAWPRPGSDPTVTIEGADLVGAWGLSLHWSDGHSTGIYPLSALREWCREDPGAP